MKKNTLILSLVFAGSLAFAQTKTINFETESFADLKAKAKKENKLIFIDCFTSQCAPCKWMAKNIFTNDAVADYFNAQFINAQFDAGIGEGREIAKLYDLNAFPSLLFIDSDGKLVQRGAGSIEAEPFIQLAKDAFNPEKRYSKFTDEYASKKTNPAFMAAYIDAAYNNFLFSDELLQDYFKTQKDEDLADRVNWNMMRNHTSNYNSREFKFLLNNEEVFSKSYTADSVNEKIAAVFLNSGYSVIYNKESKSNDYKKYIDEIKKINFASQEEVIFKLDIAYAKEKGDWKKYIQMVVEKGDNYFHTSDELNNVSWEIYENSDDKAALQKAESWMQKVIKEMPEWGNYDTYAAILYKLNKKKEAKAAADKAIELAKLSGAAEDEFKGTVELLQKIEKLK